MEAIAQNLPTVLMLVAVVAALYFLLIRPQKKRQQEQEQARDAWAPGARVMTIGGIIGTIKEIGDKQIVLEVAPDIEMTFVKNAISTNKVEDEFEYVDADEADSGSMFDAPDAIDSTDSGGAPETAPEPDDAK
jgi:preprotein translocase subunit YajC